MGHMASTGRKQRDKGWSAHFLFFIQPSTPTHGMLLLTSRVGLPTSRNSVIDYSKVCLLGESRSYLAGCHLAVSHPQSSEVPTKFC